MCNHLPLKPFSVKCYTPTKKGGIRCLLSKTSRCANKTHSFSKTFHLRSNPVSRQLSTVASFLGKSSSVSSVRRSQHTPGTSTMLQHFLSSPSGTAYTTDSPLKNIYASLSVFMTHPTQSNRSLSVSNSPDIERSASIVSVALLSDARSTPRCFSKTVTCMCLKNPTKTWTKRHATFYAMRYRH